MKSKGGKQGACLWRSFGARARMVLLYFQTQAVRTRSRGRGAGSLHAGVAGADGRFRRGETASSFREQATRISACSLKFFWEGDRRSEGWFAGRIVTSGLRFIPARRPDKKVLGGQG